MKKVLFMHSGSGNHGCEALVRTTAKLLDGPENVQLWSWSREEDVRYGAADCVERVVQTDQLRRFSPVWLEAQLRRLLGQKEPHRKAFLRQLFRGTVALSIGGDNYCYPWSARDGGQIDRQIRKYCAATVLWGCSVEEDALTEEVREDLAGFDLITARESLTWQLLKPVNPNTVLVADPAFLLETQYLPLPEGFLEGNTLGINVSPLIMHYGSDSLILRNYEALMAYVLEHTDMHICLIPHVVWDNNDDRVPLQRLYDTFRHTGKVCMVEDAGCCALKGYIARCRFFVGARTHSTIAAYSSGVPTLVTGYSVKARGIARDLMGSQEHYVLPVQALQTQQDLTQGFLWLMEHEEQTRSHLKRVLPAYIARAEEGKAALEKLLKG